MPKFNDFDLDVQNVSANQKNMLPTITTQYETLENCSTPSGGCYSNPLICETETSNCISFETEVHCYVEY